MGYESHLYKNSEGYIQILKLADGKVMKIYNTQYKGVKEIIESVEGEEDVYISPNTFYKPFRAVENIRHFRALYIDIDLKYYYKAETVYMIYEKALLEEIPEPSMVVDSGRGLHIYWRIEDAPYGALWTWQELEDFLYKKLEHLGADIKATEGARLLRLPNTYNSRSNSECKILIEKDITYSMFDLREKYLKYKSKPYQLELHQVKEFKQNKKSVVSPLFNSYSLHSYRVEDLKTLCKLRNYDVEGHRNFILHCYAYWTGIYVRDDEELEKQVIEFNNAFKKPLKENEVKAILRCIPKAINKFLDYQQRLKEGLVAKVTKGMNERGGYWYKNETLIDRLEITPEEQKKMKTIIGTTEKYDRNNKKRRASRRNEEGLTEREQQKRERIKAILELKEKGLNQSEIAEKLGISRQAISKILKNI